MIDGLHVRSCFKKGVARKRVSTEKNSKRLLNGGLLIVEGCSYMGGFT